MEAVPRLPMLKFEPKPCIDQQIYSTALKKYIRDHYCEDPNSYSNEIQELEQLRSSITFVRQDYDYCAALRKYFCQIRFLLSRFPISQPNNDGLNITFHWKDLYSSTAYEVSDVKYEQASVLYNIAVYHMTEGASENRSSPEGMKIACTHFQCAAWAYQHLRENFPQNSDCDLSPQLMSLMHTLALAQAQECILEKSITDNRKPNIIAKVAMQVVEYLSGAVRCLDSKTGPVHDIVGSKRVKTWLRYCQLKQSYYHSVAQLYLGLQAEELQKMGERLAYFKDANEKLAVAAKMAKNMDDEEAIRECLNFSHDVMGGKLTAAQKENEFVFHEKVPDVSTLAEVKGASLVKGIQFSMTDPDVAGPDIFRNLIPMEAHQASSLYSEEKASLLRKLGAQLQEKNDELDAFLASLLLEDLLLDEDPDTLPQELVSACADLNSRDALKELTAVMSKVSSAHLDISELLDRHAALLQQEEERAAEFRAMMGDKKAPNNLLVELRREGEKCRGALTVANESNLALHTAVVQYRPSLTTLSQPLQHVVSTLPSVSGAAQQAGASGAEAKAQIERLMKKVEEMQQQRWSVEQQLRQNLMEDDITGTLVTADADMAELFKEHLKKHDQQLEILEKNMSAQKNILTALSEANAAYASTRRATKQAVAARQAAIAALVQAHASFSSILDKARDANAFYEKLSAQVSKLLKRTESFVNVQEEEREGRLSAQAKKFTQRGKGDQLLPASAKGASSYTPVAPIPGGDDSSYSGSGPKLKDVLMASGGYKGLPSAGQFSPQHRAASYGASGYPYMPGTGAAAGSASGAVPAAYLASASIGAPSATTSVPAITPNYAANGASGPSYALPGVSYSSAPPVTGYNSAAGQAYPPSAPSPAPQMPPTQLPATAASSTVASYIAPAPYAPASYPSATTALPYRMPTSSQYPTASYSADPLNPAPVMATPQANSGLDAQHAQAKAAYSAPQVAPQSVNLTVAGGSSTTSTVSANSVSVTSASHQAGYMNMPSSAPAGATAASSTTGAAPYVPNPYYYPNQTYPGSNFAVVAGQQYPSAPDKSNQQYPGNFAATGRQYPARAAAAGQQYPASAAAAGQQYPASAAAAGQQYPASAAAAGQQYPGSAAATGQQYPGSAAVTGQQYPASAAAAGQQYPGSAAAAGQQYPGSAAATGQQYPGSATATGQPYPGSAAATGQPYPGSTTTTVQLYPGSTTTTVQPYPGSSTTIVQPYPGSSTTTGQPYPGSYTIGQQYPSSSAGAGQQYSTGSTGAGQQYPTGSTATGQQYPAGLPSTVSSYPLVASQTYPVGTTSSSQAYTPGALAGTEQVPSSPYTLYPSGTTVSNQQFGGAASATVPIQSYPSVPVVTGATGVSTISSRLPTSMSTAAASQAQYPTPSLAPLRAQYGSTYDSQHSYPTPQHLVSPFVPNQYPSGTGSFTPSMSMASSLRTSTPYHVESVSYHSTTASATSSGTTVVSSDKVPEGHALYRHPSAAAVPLYYYARAGAGPASNMTPSSTGSPLPYPGFGLTNGVPASSAGNDTANFGSAHPSASSEHPTYAQKSGQPYPAAAAAATAAATTTPQQQYPVQPQHPQAAHAQVSVSQIPAAGDTSSKKGISNLDLLSGIELAGPSSMWTPLTPQISNASVPDASVTSAVMKSTDISSSSIAVPTTTTAADTDVTAPLDTTAACPVVSSSLSASNGPSSVSASGAESVLSASAALGSLAHGGSIAAAATVSDSADMSTAALSIAALAQSKKAAAPQDPLDDPGTLSALTADTERLHKMVETLERRSLNGATNLEMKWREIMDAVEARCKKATVSVGRCYPFKNRFPDILPYDHSRIVLTDTSDDYINASHVQVRGNHSLPMVVSQAPTPNTAADYWLMVWQLQTELILCLHTLPEIKNASYWPEGRGAQQYGEVTVQEHNSGEGGGGAWMQRLFHLTRTTPSTSGSASTTRAVIHLQFLGWPPGGIPNHPSPLLQLCSEAVSLHRQQRVRHRPVVFTCVAGVGRSCVAALLTVFLSHLHAGGTVCDLQSLCEDACVARRGGLQDKDYLAFLYSAALYAAQELLMKRGILTNKATFEEGPLEKGHRTHVRHPSADLLAASCDFNRLKCKLGLDQSDDQPSTTQKDEAEADTCSVDWSSSMEGSERSISSHVDAVSSSPTPSTVAGLSLPPNLAASLDPQQLKIEPAAPGKGAKITKESFERASKAGLTSRQRDPDDPLSDLDPLWTLKKSE